MAYDSTADTLEHIRQVGERLLDVAAELQKRAMRHDASKLLPPEKEAFDEFTPKLRGTTYNSDQYRGFLAAMKPALDHHYAANSHHPEHYRWHCPLCELSINDAAWEKAPQGPNDSGIRYCPRCCRHGMIYESELMVAPEHGMGGMNLLDLIEMLCDWKAATLRHADGDIVRSVEQNQKRFGYSDELRQIFLNTLPFVD